MSSFLSNVITSDCVFQSQQYLLQTKFCKFGLCDSSENSQTCSLQNCLNDVRGIFLYLKNCAFFGLTCLKNRPFQWFVTNKGLYYENNSIYQKSALTSFKFMFQQFKSAKTMDLPLTVSSRFFFEILYFFVKKTSIKVKIQLF